MSKRHPGKHRKHSRRRSPRTPGQAPGTLVAEPEAEAPRITVMGYGPDAYEEAELTGVAELDRFQGKWPVLWVNVDGLADAAVIDAIGKRFGLHPLALEDVLNTHQRAKVEQYPDHLFVVARVVSLGDGGPEGEQLSIFLGEGFVVTFQERQGDPLDPVRRRIREGRPLMRAAKADYLAYAILDAVVDHYFPMLEAYGEYLDDLEDEVIYRADRTMISKIHKTRRDLLAIRRSAWPLREALNSLIRDENVLVGDNTRIYLRDCYDHVLRIVDLLENDREITSGLMDVYLSSLSNKMNEVMKLLTIIATIFIPLTFIVGVYGMNFDRASPYNMPELGWRYGYLATWGVMVVIAVIMTIYFWRKGWIGPAVERPQDEEIEEAGGPDLGE